MRVVVPFDAAEPKTRLASVLDAPERREFAERMLADVLRAVAASSVPVDGAVVLATAPVDLDVAHATTRVDDRPLSVAVNDVLGETFDADADIGTDADAVAVVMADLALATPRSIDRLCERAADVVVAPGRGVGTNALVVRTPAFAVDFHGASYLDHRRAATDAGTLATVDSFRLSTDVDEPADLVEAFVHGGSRTREWLEARFELAVDDDEGRVTLDRR
jgi:2-phospho-L-lactate guanylyltransferase